MNVPSLPSGFRPLPRVAESLERSGRRRDADEGAVGGTTPAGPLDGSSERAAVDEPSLPGPVVTSDASGPSVSSAPTTLPSARFELDTGGTANALERVADLVRFSEIRLGWNLWFYQHQEVSVLFVDGSGYDGLDVPLESFDAERARRETPERWFVWRETEDGSRERRALADEDSAWRSVRGRSILEREPAPRTLELTVATTRSDGVWNTGGTTRTSGYRFFAGGRFERFLRLLHVSEAGGEDRQHVAVRRDAGGARLVAEVNASSGEGSASVTTRLGGGEARARDDMPDTFANGGAVDGGRDVTDAFADGGTVEGARDVTDTSASERTGDREGDGATLGGDPALRGRYEIRGNTLVLHFDDGRTRAELFADLGNGALMIGDRLHV